MNFNNFGINDDLKISHDLQDKIFSELTNAKFNRVRQKRFGHYGHVFKVDDDHYPDESEAFAAQFNLCDDRNASPTFKEYFNSVFLDILRTKFPNLKYYLEPNINKMSSGDFYRQHIDTYAGEIGFTFFFSQKWMWDYGGILTFTKNDSCDSVFPSKGKILIRNEAAKPPHFVTLIPKYVESYYFLAVGWASEEDLGSSDVRGGYKKL